MKKTLFFGPYSPPITGQSLAFRAVVDSFEPGEAILIDTSKSRSKILSSLRSILLTLRYLMFRRDIQVVYFTCSRSFVGSIKDIILLLLSKNKTVINHLHGADFKEFVRNYPRLLKPLMQLAYRSVNTSIVLTEGMKSEFEEFPNMNLKTIPNFYPEDFDQGEVKKSGKLIVSYFSHIMFSKGIFDFLNALKLLRFPNEVQVQIAGQFHSDNFMSRIQVQNEFQEFLAANSSLDIKYLGEINPTDRFNFLSKSDILVLPTFYKAEGFPLVLIEGMRCGNAIVTSQHNYLTEIISDDNGRLVEARNPSTISEAISSLSGNPSELRKTQDFNTDFALREYSEAKFIQSVKRLILEN